MEEQHNRLRPWWPPQQSAHRQCVLFSLAFFDVGALLTLPRAKPDDTAAERRSTSASRNALAINVILKAAMALPRKLRELPVPHLRSHRRRSGKGSCERVPTQGCLMHSADEWKIRVVPREAIRARRMQKDQFRVEHTIPPSRSGRQASSRRPCCRKESAVASRP